MAVSLAVLTQCTNVTDTQPDRHRTTAKAHYVYHRAAIIDVGGLRHHVTNVTYSDVIGMAALPPQQPREMRESSVN